MFFLAAEAHGEFLGFTMSMADLGMARRVAGDPRWRPAAQQIREARHPPPPAMTARLRTAGCSPLELWALTMGDHDAGQDNDDEAALYGCNLDVWSYGGAVNAKSRGSRAARVVPGVASWRSVAPTTSRGWCCQGVGDRP